MAEVQAEDRVLREQIEEQEQVRESAAETHYADAMAIVKALRTRLDQPMAPALRRQLVERLVSRVRVESYKTLDEQESQIAAEYRFDAPSGRATTHSRCSDQLALTA